MAKSNAALGLLVLAGAAVLFLNIKDQSNRSSQPQKTPVFDWKNAKPAPAPYKPGPESGPYIAQPGGPGGEVIERYVPVLAPSMPTLPPGTSEEVREAVQEAFDNGTLTERQAEAVSELYAPMYYSESVNGYAVTDFGSEEAAKAALAAYMANFV